MRLLKTATVVALLLSVAVSPALAQETPSVQVEPQATSGDTVTVSQATIDQAGWIVIHPKATGEWGPDTDTVLGTQKIESGSQSDVEVQLDDELESNQLVYAMLHYDDPADDSFNFPSEDPAVQSGNETVVQDFYVVIGTSQDAQDLAELEQQRVEEERENDRLQQRREEAQQQQQQLEQNQSELQEQQGGSGADGESDGGNGLPGFTVAVALVSLAAVALASMRR